MKRKLLAGAAGALAVVLLWAGPAGAEIDGSCTATMKGIDVRPLSSTKTSDAIKVKSNETLVVAATSSSPIDGYDVKMEFAGFKWNVGSGKANGNTWSKTVNVKTYAKFGVGLYKVYGVSNGGAPCTGAVLVKIAGKNPFTTVAGAVFGVLAIGAFLGAVSGIRHGASPLNGLKVPKGYVRPIDAIDVTAPTGHVRPMDAIDVTEAPVPSGHTRPIDAIDVTADRYVGAVTAAPCPGVYVDTIEAAANAHRPDIVETVCFQGGRPTPVVAMICRWG
ncbi:MAG: hypothetical protein V7636_1663 [Actinomycetota bacterium]